MLNTEQTIIDAITKQLARIAPEVDFTVNGVSTTATELVKTVAPERLTPFSDDEFPAVFVASTEADEQMEIIGQDGHNLTVKLLLFTKEEEGLRAVRRLMADCKAAMYEDRTFGNLAIWSECQGRSMGGTDRDPVPSMTFSVKYRTAMGAL